MSGETDGPDRTERSRKSAKKWLVLSLPFVVVAIGLAAWMTLVFRGWRGGYLLGSVPGVALVLEIVAWVLYAKNSVPGRARILAIAAFGVSLSILLLCISAFALFIYGLTH